MTGGMRVCLWCKNELSGASSKQYCGGACRTAASKARKAQPKQSNTKACQWCEKKFQAKTKRAAFCSDRCRNEHHLAQKGGYKGQEGRCEYCGGSFWAMRKTKRFCNDECRVDAHFKMLGVDYESDEDFLHVRNWWLYKYRTDEGLIQSAWEEMDMAKQRLEEFDSTFFEDEELEPRVREVLNDEFLDAEWTYTELVKTRSIDQEAVKRGTKKLRAILLRHKGERAYEDIRAEMEEMSEHFAKK